MFDFPTFEKYLSNFDFPHLFIDVLGWNNPPATYKKWECDTVKDIVLSYRAIAELGGIFVIQIVADADWLDESQRLRVWKYISQRHNENLLIFTNTKAQDATQSLWYWVKRDNQNKQKLISRRHDYFKGQPVDLFASKLQAMVVELSELDSSGRLSVLEAARRIASALDVEKTTQKFFKAYQQQHLALIEHIHGIDDPRDKRWYASVLLNRLMFVWFMQKKGFLQDQNGSQRFNYLHEQLEKSDQRGINHFYGEFLAALFFEAFAKPESDRTPESIQLTGKIPYLNGGLFLPHKLELDANNNLRLGKTLYIADVAFKGIFDLFASFTWHLDDTPNGAADEINPDVLGYIFEKYINQKAFGAYYTRPEITSYLADRSIHKLILERINEPAIPELGFKEIRFDSVPDLLAQMKPRTALRLVNEVLPKISILDPSVGSGAFLVAALKSLIQIYSAVVGRAEMKMSTDLVAWLEDIKKNHASVAYYIKRRIVTDNLYGVDIMEEACEIAKLRLFLSMVASVRHVEDLEPLPNIDFNILSGNSLVGLMRVDEVEFNTKQNDLFKPRYGELVIEKNRHLDAYRHAADIVGKGFNLRELRDNIDHAMRDANTVMNGLLRDQLETAGVKFEQATWDSAKNKLGKPQKRQLLDSDIAAQTPFHWGYVFDDIIQKRGGFDIVLANPPWEVFQTDEKEFFQQYDDSIQKNKLRIEEWKKMFSSFMKHPKARTAWINHVSQFSHMVQWYKNSPDYANQTSSKINLYLLFVERSFHLLRAGGHCGIVIPSGIYTDLGAKGLRDLLFSETKIEGLFCFENRKTIFEGVDSRFKFVVLTFEKDLPRPLLDKEGWQATPDGVVSHGTQTFPAAFMRHDVEELARFPKEGALELDVNLIRRLSPDSHSVMEFKSALDVQIAEKMLQFPLLGEFIEGTWNLKLCQEFNMTTDSHLFKTEAGVGRLPLFEGKMIWQFDSAYAKPRYWVNEVEGREAVLGKRNEDTGQLLDYQTYRLGFRDVARNTDARTMIATVFSTNLFFGNTLIASSKPNDPLALLMIVSLLNSFVLDFFIRKKVTNHCNMFYVYQLPVPRLTESDPRFTPIVQRAAKLICTTPEFDDLAKAVGLKNHHDGATDPTERAQLRAELDGLIAHLYGLTEHEFSHILGTFPLVKEEVKAAALEAYRGNL